MRRCWLIIPPHQEFLKLFKPSFSCFILNCIKAAMDFAFVFAMEAVLPESSLILSQCAIYLASSAKSNSATVAIGAAMNAVNTKGDLSVPLHIRNAPTKLMKNLGYGKNYEYSHSYENNFSPQEYLPKELTGTKFYEPGKNAREEELRKFLKTLWKDKYNY